MIKTETSPNGETVLTKKGPDGRGVYLVLDHLFVRVSDGACFTSGAVLSPLSPNEAAMAKHWFKTHDAIVPDIFAGDARKAPDG